MIKIELDPGAGFCFGVDQVIKTAEDHLRKGEVLYGLGEMVHNSEEVSRLNKLGLLTIDHSELDAVKSGRVLFRAHGEPPATYQRAREKGIEIIDGTCPIVSRLQAKVKAAFEAMDHQTQQLVIFGKSDHPETIGLLGQVDQAARVVNSLADVPGIDPSKEVFLFSQTTMDPDQFREVEEGIIAHLNKHQVRSDRELLKSDCTICGQMKNRKPGLAEFAKSHDLILFVSGKNSSNGKMLYEFCTSVNPETHWISRGQDIDPAWFSGKEMVGISGATSTSMEQLQAVAEQVKKLILS
ncbi:MAG: 4-hydroxy-3-methylbut-2-enyl diphosphate reductase [Bacteroidota bacterium]